MGGIWEGSGCAPDGLLHVMRGDHIGVSSISKICILIVAALLPLNWWCLKLVLLSCFILELMLREGKFETHKMPLQKKKSS